MPENEDKKIVGRIMKALSGFWYVETENGILQCRAKGKFRLDNIVPLVGDMAAVTQLGGTDGNIEEIMPRKNYFIRPAVANIDILVIIASASVPVTDPFLIDRMAAIAELKGCEPVICFNKSDLVRAEALTALYAKAGFKVINTSTTTGEGIEKLQELIAGKLCAFTGNSGVGKSSILNLLMPDLGLPTGDISVKLGRGKHTTRHVELFRLPNGAIIADTPGFGSFGDEDINLELKQKLPYLFREFKPYLDSCRFNDCAHVSDEGCGVIEALREGKIDVSRHESYMRMRVITDKVKEWESET